MTRTIKRKFFTRVFVRYRLKYFRPSVSSSQSYFSLLLLDLGISLVPHLMGPNYHFSKDKDRVISPSEATFDALSRRLFGRPKRSNKQAIDQSQVRKYIQHPSL